MNISPDQLLDRIELKNKVSYWRKVSVILLLILMILSFSDSYQNKINITESKHIARIMVDGIITQDMHRINVMSDLGKNKSIKAVIVHVNTPGGTVVGGQSMYIAIKKLSQIKPVVVVMGEMATSAGYMLSLGANHLVALDGSLTGSIGVIAESVDVTSLAERVGVKFHHFKTSPLKGGPSPTEPLSQEMRISMEMLINDMYDIFVDIVSKERKLPKEEIIKIADGRSYTGRQAFKLNLIDQIGDEDTALQWLCKNYNFESDIKIFDYDLDVKESKLDQILGVANGMMSILEKSAFGQLKIH